MRKHLLAVTALLLTCATYAQDKSVFKDPVVINGQLVKLTKPLRDFTAADAAIPDVRVRDENGIIGNKRLPRIIDYFANQQQNSDAALQTYFLNRQHGNNGLSPDNAITANFAGIGYQPLNPPDPTLCVGTNHVIQMVNGSSGALFKVFNKTGGQVVAQTYLDAITGKG